MKRAILVILLAGRTASLPAEEAPNVALEIREDTYISSATHTICRVTATNHSGRSLDARKIVFEARAREGGRVVTAERGRFGGILPPGGSVETVIAFTGAFRDFEVGPAPEGASRAKAKSRGGRRTGAPRARKSKRRR